MIELDRVRNSDNFNFRGGGVHRFCKSAISTRRQCEKKDGKFARCWFCYISIAKFWVLDYQYVL